MLIKTNLTLKSNSSHKIKSPEKNIDRYVVSFPVTQENSVFSKFPISEIEEKGDLIKKFFIFRFIN
jgi:hypothetical protein